ncbi:MAG: glycoside hydrolase family 28 protein [Bacteroidia bacterium]|jgi:polygalacturonase|nr:glycoside hydrolase family 28 protein [Bacteroidia bacterium]
MKRVLLVFVLTTCTILLQSQSVWTNVKERGADPTGNVKCTKIISDVISELSAKGGGTVYFPAGTFLTGPIIMKSNITLWLDGGAVVKFSDDFDDYLPMVQSRWEDVRVKNFVSQIYAYQCENISIRGRGHFEGQGKKWWDFMRTVGSQQQPSKWQETFKKENEELLAKNAYIRAKNNFLRPPMVTTYECKNVLIEGVSFSNPPFWTIMPAFTDNITINGITIENPAGSPNTDGIDPSSCRYVHISNCHITVGDDCIVIKSGRDEDGREAARPTEDITITNCTMLRGHGGVVIGSEMSGNVKRVAITNCVFEGTDRGIRIKTMRGRGGVIEDLLVSNIVMNNMINEGVLITLRYQQTQPEPLSERTPACNNVRISNIIVRGGQRPVAIYGLEEREVNQVSFSNMESSTRRGILIENGSDINFHDIKMEIKEGNAIEVKNSKKISWDKVTVTTPLLDLPIMKLTNCNGVTYTNCYQPEAFPLLIGEDETSENIIIANNIFPGTTSLTNNKGKNIITSNNIMKK